MIGQILQLSTILGMLRCFDLDLVLTPLAIPDNVGL
jgi:hypothetical protein